jgi:hypothetical protein
MIRSAIAATPLRDRLTHKRRELAPHELEVDSRLR